MMIFRGLTLGFGFIMVHTCFVSCHDVMKKFLIFVIRV